MFRILSPRSIWRYSQADFDTANMLLDECDWDELLSGDVNHMWAAWEERFMTVMRQCIPTAKLSAKPNLPCMAQL